jgi:hypothetical protein
MILWMSMSTPRTMVTITDSKKCIKSLSNSKQKKGHCCTVVPSTEDDDGGPLCEFARYVRGLNKNNTHTHKPLSDDGFLSPARLTKLNPLGFFEVGGPHRRRDQDKDEDKVVWEAELAKLEEFKRKTGHCRIPKDNKNHPLFTTVNKIRKLRKGTCRAGDYYFALSHDKIQKLDEIGFLWDHTRADWEEFYENGRGIQTEPWALCHSDETECHDAEEGPHVQYYLKQRISPDDLLTE